MPMVAQMGVFFTKFRIQFERGATLRVGGRGETGPLLEIIPDAHAAHGETHQVDALPVNGKPSSRPSMISKTALLRARLDQPPVPPTGANERWAPFARRGHSRATTGGRFLSESVRSSCTHRNGRAGQGRGRVFAARLDIARNVDDVFQRLTAGTCPLAQLILGRRGLSPKRSAGERDHGSEEKNGRKETMICHAE